MDSYQFVKQSQWVNGKWYLAEYPDVKLLGMDPVEHYLKIGARLGRNPCKRFDTKFYLTNYPDVAANGMNPLVHYLRYGMKEGRYPRPNRVDLLFHSLWAGHSISALDELQAIYTDPQQTGKSRYEAAWQTARWRAFEGNYEEALRLALLMAEVDPVRTKAKERVLLLADCYLALGNTSDAQTVLHDYEMTFPGDSDIAFFLANTYLGNDTKRLALINQALETAGVIGIQRKDARKPLRFDNIEAQREPLSKLQAREAYQPEKVSVIIPAYNAEDKIHVAIESLLAQTWRNTEIIVVDDCSPDRTFEVVERMAKRDARIVPVRQPQNAGAYAARNAGLKYVTGDFITTHDSDDWSHPQKLENQVLTLREQGHVMGVITHWIRSLDDLRFTQNWRPSDKLTHWSHSSFMFRKQVLDDVGHWDEVRIGADTEFIWRVEQQYGKASVIKIRDDVPLAFALDDEGSLTRTKATHVSTVYYGLRHIYRQICAWWHRSHHKLHLDNGAQEERIFTVPRGMTTRDVTTQYFDAVLVADFSKAEDCEPLFAYARKLHSDGKKVAIFHWPTFGEKQFKLADAYFELVYNGHAFPVVYGDEVSAPKFIASNIELLAFELDAVPVFKGIEQGFVLGGTELTHAYHRQEFETRAEAVCKTVFGCSATPVDAVRLL